MSEQGLEENSSERGQSRNSAVAVPFKSAPNLMVMSDLPLSPIFELQSSEPKVDLATSCSPIQQEPMPERIMSLHYSDNGE